MNLNKYIEVSFSPALLPQPLPDNTIVVVIDILRASSSITVAINNDVDHIVPVAKIEDCLAYRDKGYIIAGERKGEILPDFDLGNSPFGFMNPELKGKKIAMTTTNGTQAVQLAKLADSIVFGSFLNMNFLVEWLKTQNKNIICLCAGWENKFNLEDTLFAGALVHYLSQDFQLTVNCDPAIAAEQLYIAAKNDLYAFLETSSHRKRLKKLNIDEDVKYCLTTNSIQAIPIMKGGNIVKLGYESEISKLVSNLNAGNKNY